MRQRVAQYAYIGYGVLVVLVLLVVSHVSMRHPVTVVAGTHDDWYVQRWYDAEEIAGRPMRWSEPQATLAMPRTHMGWQVAEMWLLNGRPNGTPAQQVIITAAAQPAQAVMVAGWQLRRYALLWRPATLHWAEHWTITTPTPIMLPEQRSVGVLWAQLRTTPTTLADPWVSYGTLVVLGSMLVLWSVLTLAGVRSAQVRIHSCLLSALVLTGALVWRPSDTLPWLHWPLVCGMVVLVWQGWVRVLGWVRTTPPHQLAVDGHLMPILMGSAWLVMPWLQYALMRADIYVLGFAIYPQELRVWSTISIAVLSGIAVLGRWLAWPRVTAFVPWGILGVCVIATVHYLATSWQAIQHVGSADFDVWVIAARYWLATGSLYNVPQIAGDVFGYVYKYPPLYGMLFIPLAGYNEMELLRSYRMLDILLLVWTAAIWVHIIKPQRWVWWLGAMLICVNLNPVLETLKYGQIDVVVLWLCSIIYWCLHHEYDDVAGWLVALLISVKMYPAVLLIWFVLQRRWYAVRGTIIGGVVLNLLGMAVVGWRDYYTFMFEVLPIIGGTTAYVENQTIAAFLARLIEPSYPLAPFTHALWAPVTTVVSLLVMVALFVVCARPVPPAHPAHALQFAMVIMMTAVAIPVAWIGYQVPLWLVFVVVLWHTMHRVVPWYQAGLVAMSFALIGFGNFLSFVFALDVGWLTIITDSYKLYGMLILTVMLWVWTWQCTRSPLQVP